MKQFFRITSLIIVISITLVSCDKAISIDKLPDGITSYISTHFPSHSILKANIDRDGLKKFYDVKLDGSIDLEFNKKEEITEIDGNSKLPDSVIPEKVREYVASKYPNNVITDWELEKKTQEIELDNGLGLVFNMDGDFLRIDD